jgi:hypothetical protein
MSWKGLVFCNELVLVNAMVLRLEEGDFDLKL